MKWHLKAQQGIKNLSAADAVRLAGSDPDHAQRDLFNAIAAGDFPKWNVSIQVMTEAQAVAFENKTRWNPFDLTKVWPYGDFPRIPVGVLELNRNPDNYCEHVEQAAFSPANIVPGLWYNDDFTQAGNLYRVMKPDAQDRLTSNIAGAMKDVSDEIKQRQIAHFNKADPAYGAAVSRKLAALGAADREPAKPRSVA